MTTNKSITEMFAELSTGSGFMRYSMDGCTEAEIAQIRLHFGGHDLPKVYEEFLRVAGRGAGRLFQGHHIYYPDLLHLQNAAKRLLIANGGTLSLPENAMVFLMHQGYMFHFILPTDEDPQIFTYVEGTNTDAFSCAGSFSRFLELSIERHLDFIKYYRK